MPMDYYVVQKLMYPYYYQITPFKSVKARFDSVVDWQLNSNIIRANPNFHHKPRYDYALVKADDSGKQCIFVQVLYIFRIIYQGVHYHMALVIPFDVPPHILDHHPNRDTELRLTRVRPRLRGSSILIDTDRIIRGGLLAEDPDSPITVQERLVVNFIDQDMWMRLKSIELITNANM